MIDQSSTTLGSVGAAGGCGFDDLDQVFNLSIPLCIVDENDVIQRINDAFGAFLGRSREEVVGCRCGDVFSHRCCASGGDGLDVILTGAARSSSEVEILTATGDIRTCVVTGSPYADRLGRRIGTIACFIDITGRKRDEVERARLEEQLRQSQKVESVGRLAGGVAHDFNNMLSVILGYTDILLRKPSGDEGVMTMIEDINKAGLRARDLTRQLLAFSRRQVLEMRNVDLNEIVRSNEKMLRRLVGEGILLQVYLNPMPITVNADVSQILQVLMNLIVNARDAMGEAGTCLIETSVASAGDVPAEVGEAHRRERFAMLLVSDTGHGMSQEMRDFIFDPFFTTKEKGKGTGLGLSTVQGIVKQHGGEIVVESEPGEGARFKIYLPRIDEGAELRTEPAPRTDRVVGTERILLVEDEVMVRRLAREVLVSHGYEVLEAASADEAIRLVEACPETIDLLLTDVVMPVMNGRELHRYLSLSRPRMKVLFMSGYVGDEALESGSSVGDDGAFLQKPLTVVRLTQKVREVLDR